MNTAVSSGDMSGNDRHGTESVRPSEEQLRDIVDGTSDLIQSVAPDGRILYVNRAWRETLGYAEDQLAALNIFDVIHADCREHCSAIFQRLMAGEDVGLVNVVFRAKDGRAVEVEGRINARVENGAPVATRGIFRDVTERWEAEAAQRQLKDRLNFLLSNSPAVIYTCEVAPPYAPTFITDNLTEMLGYAPEEFLSTPTFWADHIHPDDRDRVFAGLADLFVHGRHLHEYRFQRQDGSWLWMRDAIRVVTGVDSQPAELIGYFIDITAQKQAEAALHEHSAQLERLVREQTVALRESEERVRLASEAADIGVWDWDVRTGTVSWDERMFAIYGLSPTPTGIVAYDDWRGAVLPGDIEETERRLQHTAKHGGRGQREFRIVRASDQAERVIYAAEMGITGSDGQVTRVVGINIDITERKRQERQLLESEILYRSLFESSPDGILIADAKTKVFRYANPAICEMLGYTVEEMMRMSVSDIRPHDALPQVLADFESMWHGEKRLARDLPCLRKNGTMFYVDISTGVLPLEGRPCVVGFFRDVTDRQESAELRRVTAELQSFNEAMVGRERRIIEIKEEVNALCRELGREPEYPPVWEQE